jgi:glutathione peroxidase
MRKLLMLAAWVLLPLTAYADCPSLLQHRFTSLQGEEIDLCHYADRVILVVNTASKCGYTPQFEKLEGMYRQYKDRGLMVVGFPSNDFNQELASDGEIAKFCKFTYAVDFPMIAKGSVIGAQANAFYKQLRVASGQEPRWNFHKYVIAPGAKAVHSFGTRTEPDAPDIMARIKPYLK